MILKYSVLIILTEYKVKFMVISSLLSSWVDRQIFIFHIKQCYYIFLFKIYIFWFISNKSFEILFTNIACMFSYKVNQNWSRDLRNSTEPNRVRWILPGWKCCSLYGDNILRSSRSLRCDNPQLLASTCSTNCRW